MRDEERTLSRMAMARYADVVQELAAASCDCRCIGEATRCLEWA